MENINNYIKIIILKIDFNINHIIYSILKSI